MKHYITILYLLLSPALFYSQSNTKIGFFTDDDFDVLNNPVAHYGMSSITVPGQLYIGLSGYYGLNFYTSGSERMKILRNGNVGIGTSTPTESLEVKGLIKVESANNQDNNSPGIVTASNDDFLYNGQYINHYGFGFHGYNDGSTSFSEPINAYISGFYGIDFFTSGRSGMRISHDGLVSIGTVNRNPGFKLAVNGNIRAKEIKVESNWSDFVFEKSYNLPTLEEVEKHIKEKGHLKDIPSAEEVEKNGIYLGQMDAKLLQKIEELTLYVIELKKENNDLKEENTLHYKMIKDMKQEIKELNQKN